MTPPYFLDRNSSHGEPNLPESLPRTLLRAFGNLLHDVVVQEEGKPWS